MGIQFNPGQFVGSKSTDIATRSKEQVKHDSAQFAEMVEKRLVPHTDGKAKQAANPRRRLAQHRAARTKARSMGGGRRRQSANKGKGKNRFGVAGDSSDDDAMEENIDSEEGDRAATVSVDTFTGDADDTNTQEQIADLFKKRKHIADAGHVAMPAHQFIGAAQKDDFDTDAGKTPMQGRFRSDNGFVKTQSSELEEEDLYDVEQGEMFSGFSGHPDTLAGFEELSQAMADQTTNQLRIIEQLASDIVVAGTTTPLEKEIRIRIKDSVLEATVVRLVRNNETLLIDFSTTSPSSYQWLKKHQRELEQHVWQLMELDEEKDRKHSKKDFKSIKIRVMQNHQRQDHFDDPSSWKHNHGWKIA